jgi:hypothetical protein
MQHMACGRIRREIEKIDSLAPQSGDRDRERGFEKTRHLTPTLSPVGDGGEGEDTRRTRFRCREDHLGSSSPTPWTLVCVRNGPS